MTQRPTQPPPASSANPPALRNKRAIPRQATSRVAFEHEPPSPEDALLAFEPYRHAQPRSNSITPDLQREFVAHLAATGIVSAAARHIGRSLEALYKLRHRSGAEGFASAWDRAVQLGVERLEDTALARAIEGTVRHVVRGGEVIATERVHNEALVMFFLKTRLADRYSPSAQVGPGHPVYEKAYRAVEAERARRDADPVQRQKIRDNIDAKVRQWKLELVQEWNRQVLEYNRENGTTLPVLGKDGKLEFRDGPPAHDELRAAGSA
jgi:hypothetical protein